MPQTNKTNSDASAQNSGSRTGLLDHATTSPSPIQPPQPSNGLNSHQAADEALQTLAEIAGSDYSNRADHNRSSNAAQTAKAVLLSPLKAGRAALKLLANPLRRTDLKMAGEMRKFLQHPGHFFWFNRIAPNAAAQHFGTSSTDAMTHHARRYGAHSAMLVLAVVVVVFGGFSGLAAQVVSTYATVPNPPTLDGNLLVTGDGREIYTSAVASGSTAFNRRVETATVREGDSLRGIASLRNLSLETLLYANGLLDPDQSLSPGQKLVIPPTTGMLHIVNPGDTVEKIADLYAVDPSIILSYQFNNLENVDGSTPLRPLQEIMVPGGSLPQRTKLYMYEVRAGDTLQSVADKFGLKPGTLVDNNELAAGLTPKQQIRILPVDGVIYKVKKGDTLDGIASYLGTSPENIVNFRPNNVARGVRLEPGQSLIVPGGSWPPPPVAQPVAPKPAQANTAAQSKPAVQPKAASVLSAGRATGHMVWPQRGTITTYFGQPIWYGIHKGLDIARGCGTPVVAADGGMVVESGWSNWGYGFTVVIDHGGGIRTRYAHFIRIAAGLGARVSKGQIVGYEGTTGNSTGCHLHFEVVVGGRFTNPLGWLP